MGMRWILTWKHREDGTRKAEARAVLLGYQDPAYKHRSTTAPVQERLVNRDRCFCNKLQTDPGLCTKGMCRGHSSKVENTLVSSLHTL